MGFSPIGRYIGLMMRGMLEKDFDTGLANLKKLAESEPRAPVTTEPETNGASNTSTDVPAVEADGSTSTGDASATDPTPVDAEAVTEPASDAVSPDATPDVPTASDEASAASDGASNAEPAVAPN
jgi:hypothetical protein